MTWILLALLLYLFAGALLVAHSMRGMHVNARSGDWLALIVFWPLMLRFFLQLTALQASMRQLEDRVDGGRRKR